MKAVVKRKETGMQEMVLENDQGTEMAEKKKEVTEMTETVLVKQQFIGKEEVVEMTETVDEEQRVVKNEEIFLTEKEELLEMNKMKVEQLLLAYPAGKGRGRTWINYVFTPVLNGAIFIGVISVIFAVFFWGDGTTVINEGLRKTYGVVVVDPSPNVVVNPSPNVVVDPIPNVVVNPSPNVIGHPTPNPSEFDHHKNIIKNKRRKHMVRRKDAGEGPISKIVSIMGFTEDDKPLITMLFSIPRISFLFGIFFSVYKATRQAWGTLKFAYKAYDTGRKALQKVNDVHQNIQGFVNQGVHPARGPGRTLSLLKSRAFFIGVISIVLFIVSFYVDSTFVSNGLLKKTHDAVDPTPNPLSNNELGHLDDIFKNKRREHTIRRKDAGEGPISKFVSIMGFTEDDKPLISMLFSIPRISFLFGIFFSVYKAIRQAWGMLKFAYKAYDNGRKALQKLNGVGQNIQGFVNPGVDRGRRPGRTLSVLKSRSFFIGVISTLLFIASFYADSTSIINEGLLRKTYDVVDPTPNPLSNSVAGKGVASTQADEHVLVSQIDGSQITKLTDDDVVVVGKEAITKQVDNRVVTKPTDHDGVVNDQGVYRGA